MSIHPRDQSLRYKKGERTETPTEYRLFTGLPTHHCIDRSIGLINDRPHLLNGFFHRLGSESKT